MCREKTDWEKAMEFHGHVCLGLAFGYRAAKAGMDLIEAKRAPDEEVVVIAETDNCGEMCIRDRERAQLLFFP